MAEVQEKKVFQSENNVEVTGVLEEITITQTRKDGAPLETKDGVPFKTARVKVKVAEGETHQIELMAMKYFANDPNTETGQWKAFNTYENEYVSIKDTEDSKSEHFGGTPSVVTVAAQLELNVYKNKAGVLQETNRLRGRFMRRENEKKEDEFGAIYTIDAVIVADPRPEEVKEEETGRLLIDVGIVDYQNKLQPFTFVAENIVDANGDEQDVVGYLEETVERGQTMTLNGKIINRYLVTKVERPGEGFGKATVDVKRDRVNEILIEGGMAPRDYDDYDEDDDADLVVFPDQFKEAQKNWKKFVTDIESAEVKKAPAKKSNKGFGKPASARKISAENLDLPF